MITFTLGNGTTQPLITITITEVSPGVLNFPITQSGSVVGDLADFSSTRWRMFRRARLMILDAVYTYANQSTWTIDTPTEVSKLTSVSGEDSVTNLSGGVNMNGALGTSGDGYDFGIAIGQEGIGTKGTIVDYSIASSGNTISKIADDVRSLSFTLEGEGLSLSDFYSMDFGVRLTAVGTVGGARTDSLKLVGSAPAGVSVNIVDASLNDANDSSEVTFTFSEAVNPGLGGARHAGRHPVGPGLERDQHGGDGDVHGGPGQRRGGLGCGGVLHRRGRQRRAGDTDTVPIDTAIRRLRSTSSMLRSMTPTRSSEVTFTFSEAVIPASVVLDIQGGTLSDPGLERDQHGWRRRRSRRPGQRCGGLG